MIKWPWLEKQIAKFKVGTSSTFSTELLNLYAEKTEAETNMPEGSIRTLKLANVYQRLSNAYAIRTMYGKTNEGLLVTKYHELYLSFREQGILQKQKEDRTNVKGN